VGGAEVVAVAGAVVAAVVGAAVVVCAAVACVCGVAEVVVAVGGGASARGCAAGFPPQADADDITARAG